jgi:hypothetical protein
VINSWKSVCNCIIEREREKRKMGNDDKFKTDREGNAKRSREWVWLWMYLNSAIEEQLILTQRRQKATGR